MVYKGLTWSASPTDMYKFIFSHKYFPAPLPGTYARVPCPLTPLLHSGICLNAAASEMTSPTSVSKRATPPAHTHTHTLYPLNLFYFALECLSLSLLSTIAYICWTPILYVCIDFSDSSGFWLEHGHLKSLQLSLFWSHSLLLLILSGAPT